LALLFLSVLFSIHSKPSPPLPSQEEERRKAQEKGQREAEAHALKKQWDTEQAKYEEQKRLEKMPQWKRDLLARQQTT